jgi:chromosome segregation ATPase
MIKKKINTKYGIATLNKNGYYEVERNGNKVNLHKLIYIANNGEVPKDYTIHHKNGVKTDNDPRNLVAMPKRYHKLVHDGYNDNSKRGVKMNNKKLCKTIEKLQEGLNFAREELKELKENNERYTDNLAEKELLIAEKEKEILDYKEKLEKLVEENKELAERNKELRLVLLDVEALLQEANDEITILNYEIRNKDKELAETKEELKTTHKELQKISKENQELKTKVEEDSKRIDNLDILMNDLQDEINEVLNEEDELRTETEELIDDIDNLENSTFGLTEAGFNSLPEEAKIEFRRNASKAIEHRLLDIRVRFDKLKGRHGELQALYNGICRRRQKLQLNGIL